MAIPENPDALLRRNEVARALTDSGYPTATSTLAWLASMGGGPIFSKYGRFPVYRWGDALDWAVSRLSRPVKSTSELTATPTEARHPEIRRLRRRQEADRTASSAAVGDQPSA